MDDNPILGPGPTLTWHPIHGHDAPHLAAEEVAARAVGLLCKPVTLHPRLTLVDVFGLLDACPALLRVFRRDSADALCVEARKGALPQAPGSDPAERAGIEALELHWSWTLDTASSTDGSVQRLDRHGVGHVLQADAPDHGVKAGERIHWSVSLTPLRERLALPVRIGDELRIAEDDIHTVAYGTQVATRRSRDVALGQVLHGRLWELSSYGGPEGQAEFRGELDARHAQVDTGTAKRISGNELLTGSDRPGFESLFEALGGIAPADVIGVLGSIGDDEPVGHAWHRRSPVRSWSRRSSLTDPAANSARHFAPRDGRRMVVTGGAAAPAAASIG